MDTSPQQEKPLQKKNGSFHTTLKDVASLAGVSTKTVSRVVNNQGEISDATRERVQQAIDQLGYRPNILARSLIHKRTNTLGVVAWGIEYFGPSRTVVGIEQQAHQLEYSLLLNLVDRPDNSDSEQVLDTLITHRVDGILWAVPESRLVEIVSHGSTTPDRFSEHEATIRVGYRLCGQLFWSKTSHPALD
jgi:DNA-binding LacI/PurR family transcriptional regulator